MRVLKKWVDWMAAAVAAGVLASGAAWAETVELVTYYPAPGSGSGGHVGSLTVGDAYEGVTAPDGMVFIEDRMGIGPGFTENNPPLGSLHVVGAAGQNDRVLFMPGAGAGSTMRVGIGTVNPIDAALEVKGLPNAAGNVVVAVSEATNNAANAPSLVLRRDRGTDAAPLAVQNGDSLGRLEFVGHDGANRITGAQIRAEIDGTPGANDLPTRLVFATTPDGAAAPVERMRITADGNIGVGNAYAPGAAVPNGLAGNLDVNDIYLRSLGRWASESRPQIWSARPAANVSLSLTSGGAAQTIDLVSQQVTTRGGSLLILGKMYVVTGTVQAVDTDSLALVRGGTALDVSAYTFGNDSVAFHGGTGSGWGACLTVMLVESLAAGTYTYTLRANSNTLSSHPHTARVDGTSLVVIEL